MNREYQRLLERDQNPLNFLYSGTHMSQTRYPTSDVLAQAFGVIGAPTSPSTLP
jgi:hypothetical protein